MTGKSFRNRLFLVSLILLLVAIYTYVAPDKQASETRAAIPLYLAIGVAYLTYSLQRRIAYTNALRPLWERIVATVQEAVTFTLSSKRDEKTYTELMMNLSCRIDEVRGVFRNVGERYMKPSTRAQVFVRSIRHAGNIEAMARALQNYGKETDHRGLYPFESLKQIQEVIRILGFGSQSTSEAGSTAHEAILALWSILRAELLKELDRDFPEFPDTPYEKIGPGSRPRPAVAKLMDQDN